jgi:ATP diphosphatase
MKHTAELLAIMKRLRDPNGGCPWDIEQDFASIAPHTIEEAYEVADAIERGDIGALKEELGDLLLQVIFLSQIADEEGLFCFEDVADSINQKLIRRHPHIFGEHEGVKTAADQSALWEAIKAGEREAKTQEAASVLDDIPLNLPALLRASKLQKRVSRVGFDWKKTDDLFAKIEEEINELREAIAKDDPQNIEEELGDILFCLANLGNRIGTNAEESLRSANRKFEKRFRYVEQQTVLQGKMLEESTLEEMDALWDEAKRG